MKILSLPREDGKYRYEVQYAEEEPTILELDERLPEGSLHIYDKPIVKIKPVKKEFNIFGHKPDGMLIVYGFWSVFPFWMVYINRLDVNSLLFSSFLYMIVFGINFHFFIKRYWEIKNSKQNQEERP